MKKSLLLLILTFAGLLLYAQSAQAQYHLNKKKYDHSSYTFERTDPYRPAHSIVASALMPGLGQAIADEPLRGLAFLGVEIIGIAAISSGFGNYWDGEPKIKLSTATADALLIIGYSIFVLNRLVAARDAGKVAKVNSMALRDHNRIGQIQLYPNVALNSQSGSFETGFKLLWRL